MAESSLTLEDVRRAFYDQVSVEWWIREVTLDPVELVVEDWAGDMWRVPVTISGGAIAFGGFVKLPSSVGPGRPPPAWYGLRQRWQARGRP